MKKLILLIVMCAAPLLHGADIELPTKLRTYEDFVVRKISSGTTSAKEEGKIRVTVAAGDGDDVQRQDEMEIPRGSTAADAAAQWRKKYRVPLLGWAQGFVVVRRKVGDKVERITWTMH